MRSLARGRARSRGLPGHGPSPTIIGGQSTAATRCRRLRDRRTTPRRRREPPRHRDRERDEHPIQVRRIRAGDRHCDEGRERQVGRPSWQRSHPPAGHVRQDPERQHERDGEDRAAIRPGFAEHPGGGESTRLAREQPFVDPVAEGLFVVLAEQDGEAPDVGRAGEIRVAPRNVSGDDIECLRVDQEDPIDVRRTANPAMSAAPVKPPSGPTRTSGRRRTGRGPRPPGQPPGERRGDARPTRRRAGPRSRAQGAGLATRGRSRARPLRRGPRRRPSDREPAPTPGRPRRRRGLPAARASGTGRRAGRRSPPGWAADRAR